MDTVALTRRERVILAQLAEPLTLSEIASSLYVTRNTVKSQVRSIYLKLGVADRESALAVGRARGLVSAGRGLHDVPRRSVQTSTR